MLDLNEHTVSRNEGTEKITGYRADEILGQHWIPLSLISLKRSPTPAPSLLLSLKFHFPEVTRESATTYPLD